MKIPFFLTEAQSNVLLAASIVFIAACVVGIIKINKKLKSQSK